MSSDSSIIKLNIGGTLFHTTKSTLTRHDGFFRTLLETDVPVIKDETGAIFIDRNHKHFPIILDYMRDGDVITALQNLSENERQEIQKEAQFYLLDGLVDLCKPEISEKIKLNIGGTIFETTRNTLMTFDGVFKNMMDMREKTCTSEIFIDRSPKHFELILSFMRFKFQDGKFELPANLREIKEIRIEAHYYKLTVLENLCKSKIPEIDENRRKFNVGGTVFETKYWSWENELIGEMSLVNRDQPPDESGCIFIDRDPKHFRLILNFIRENDVILPNSEIELREIIEEADYYKIKGLYQKCEKKMEAICQFRR